MFDRNDLPEVVERLLARADEYRGRVGELDAFRELSKLLRADPVERVDPRDFLDPTSRAVAYLDLDDPDSARRTLSGISLDRLRRLGEHYDRLSMICFELVSPAHHAADNAVDPASFRAGPDEVAERPGRPVQAAPVVDFEVGDLDDLGHADTSERNLP